MKKLGSVLIALAFVAGGCSLGGGGGDERTILVDYSHDEFASSLFQNFPGDIEATPGMTLVFKQTWTGEPHTVTGGTRVNEMMSKGKPWIDFFTSFEGLMGAGVELPDPENPKGSASDLFEAIDRAAPKHKKLVDQLYSSYDTLLKEGIPLVDRKDPGDATFKSLVKTVDKHSNDFFENIGLPWAFGENGPTQNAGQPCYLTKGLPPKKENKACAKRDQRQPEFDGKASYYNSGTIQYEGPQGNTYRVKLADDIKPGNYFFYCAVHGVEQSTEVQVSPPGTSVPSQEDVNRRARVEIAEYTKPMLKVFRGAQDGKIDVDGKTLEGPFAGVNVPVHSTLNEMIPKTFKTKVGEKVTWKIMGSDHSISFDVPRYFPIIRFAKNGHVSLNPKLDKPAGGSPKIPDQEGEGIQTVDGGTYDGSGFFSSGLFGAEPYAEYSLRFSKPGTYKYACLLHPPMVGTVTVTR
jgi:plastocyanin